MPSRRDALALLSALALPRPVLAQPAPPVDPRWPASLEEHVLAVRRTLRSVDIDGFRAVVAEPRGALLIDVREPDELAATGRIPGTVHIPRGLLEFRIWRTLGHPGPVDRGRAIYTHCANGLRGTLSARQLADVGFTNVTAVVMEVAEWQRRGWPLERAG